jgi:outer membrane translocation and assembly module TamA
MSSPASEEATEKSLPVETIDAERIRSSIARLTSNSTDELGKLMAELERLQEFLKTETERVQREIEGVLDGIGIIIEAIAPWKTAGLAGAQNSPANGRDKLKRWPWFTTGWYRRHRPLLIPKL